MRATAGKSGVMLGDTGACGGKELKGVCGVGLWRNCFEWEDWWVEGGSGDTLRVDEAEFAGFR